MPPPIPEAARRLRLESIPSTTELQNQDVVEAMEVNGFAGLHVCATLEKKDKRKLGGKELGANQDSVILDPETGLVGVSDGLGGEGQGDKASEEASLSFPSAFIAAEHRLKKASIADLQKRLVDQQMRRMSNRGKEKQITTMVEQMLVSDPTMARKAAALLESFRVINESVKETAGKATATVGFVHQLPNGDRYAVVASVGDSTAYKRRKNGEMLAMNEEDSLLSTLLGSGMLKPERLAQMKNDENETVEIAGKPMTYKNLKRQMVAALGSNTFEPSLVVRKLEPGDSLIFATDGMVDKFEDPTTEETDLNAVAITYDTGKTPRERLDALRKEAKKRVTYKDDDDIGLVSVEALAA